MRKKTLTAPSTRHIKDKEMGGGEVGDYFGHSFFFMHSPPVFAWLLPLQICLQVIINLELHQTWRADILNKLHWFQKKDLQNIFIAELVFPSCVYLQGNTRKAILSSINFSQEMPEGQNVSLLSFYRLMQGHLQICLRTDPSQVYHELKDFSIKALRCQEGTS